MKIQLAYGTGELEVTVPSGAELSVVRPTHAPGLADQIGAVREGLRNPINERPLAELAAESSRVGIVFSDITRATPYDVILPAILHELRNVPDAQIVLFNATGTHRANTNDELIQILGSEAVSRFRIVQNDSTDDDTHQEVGTTPNGTPVEVLTEFFECDLKIATGFIEPHFFAGMSGGPKAIVPGLASLRTIRGNHSAAHMDDPLVQWGETDGNPLWEELLHAAQCVGRSFLVNVAMNRAKEITAVFCGDLYAAHKAGSEFVRKSAMTRVDSRFDIVVTSNSGHPLDLNMYQSVKGMSAARQVVRDGGHIVVAASCWDGVPDHGSYGSLLANASSATDLLRTIRSPGFAAQDMWQAQVHAQICEKVSVHFHSDGLSDEQIASAFMEPTHDISKTVEYLISEGAGNRICVLPEGPLTIPYVDRTEEQRPSDAGVAYG